MADKTNKIDPSEQDPREKAAGDTSQQKSIAYPGTEGELTPQADHGQDSYKGFGRLKGKVALITGGDSGIGRAVAIAYAREGADVVISYLSEEEDATETVRLVEEAGQRGLAIGGDIQKEAHCAKLIDTTVAKFGRLDILVNNAAFQMERESIDEVSTEEMERTFRTNIFAMFWLSKMGLKHIQKGGVIINTASIQAFDPSPGLLAYAATKAAIVNFSKSLAKIAMDKGIRVNAVAPGPVWTPLIPSTMPEEHVQRFGQNTTHGRMAQPAELAPIYVFLASSESAYVTGEVYGATGGRSPV